MEQTKSVLAQENLDRECLDNKNLVTKIDGDTDKNRDREGLKYESLKYENSDAENLAQENFDQANL